MNIAIVGKSQVNDILKMRLTAEGFIPFLFENINDIKSISGDKWNFTIKTSGSSIGAGYVIVTEELTTEKSISDGSAGNVPYYSLTSLENLDKINDSNMPVVFVLDFPSESPGYMTEIALQKAVKLAGRKKRVLYLSKFMRTAGNEVESLYKEARNTGITFIKYSEISIDYDQDSGLFRIDAADGYGNVRVHTCALIAADRIVPGGSAGKIAGILRLKQDEDGFVNEDINFLFPTLTSRNGVFYLNSTSTAKQEEVLERIQFTISAIRSEVNGIYKNTPDSHAEVDPGKCAFCYTCYRACPHAAMAPDYENSAMKNLENGCQACGICVSVCPADAIRITAKDHEAEEVERNALKIFCCENSGEIVVRKLKNELGSMYNRIKVAPVSCSGEISVETIASALNNFEKILVVTCMDGACKHFEGNKRAQRCVEKVRELLKAAGMDENRVECLKVSHAMPFVVRDRIEEMV